MLVFSKKHLVSQDITLVVIGIAVLLSYWFVHLAGRYRLPSVVLLLFTGILVRTATNFFHCTLTFPTQLLSTLGSVGLILIVLLPELPLRRHRGSPEPVAEPGEAQGEQSREPARV